VNQGGRKEDGEPQVRLSRSQVTAIRQAVSEAFGPDAKVWLFGSRARENALGGDIDLLVQPASDDISEPLRRKLTLLGRLEQALGERKIDMVIEERNDARAIVQVARSTGVQL